MRAGVVLPAVILISAAVTMSAQGPGRGQAPAPEWPSTMANPYRMVENWPSLGEIRSGAAIGIIPDGKGGVWLHHRSDPPIIHFDASGKILKTFGDTMFEGMGGTGNGLESWASSAQIGLAF